MFSNFISNYFKYSAYGAAGGAAVGLGVAAILSIPLVCMVMDEDKNKTKLEKFKIISNHAGQFTGYSVYAGVMIGGFPVTVPTSYLYYKFFYEYPLDRQYKLSQLHTKLMEAASNSDLEKLGDSLNQGANLNYRSHDGNTPLILAAKKNQPNAIKYLLEKGANKSLRDFAGKTAEEIAIEKNYSEVVNEFKKQKVIASCIELKKFDQNFFSMFGNRKNNRGETENNSVADKNIKKPGLIDRKGPC